MFKPAIAQSLAVKAKLFRGFSDASRLSILETLRDGPRSVGDIVDATGLSQPNTSNHLSCLLDCGLVSREQQGRRVIYQLAAEQVNSLLTQADDLLAGIASGVETCHRYEEGA
jgi:DNA-binding transcriptional ArsR family regulator